MIRTIKGLYQILTGHYVQVALAWVGIFYLLITFGHWFRSRYVHSEAEERENQDLYVQQLGCLGIIVVGAGVLFISFLVLFILGITLERNGLSSGLACLTPFLLVALIILYALLKESLARLRK